MTKEEKYLLACRFAIDKLIERDSVYCDIKDDSGKWESIPWFEIINWIDEKYGIEKTYIQTRYVSKGMSHSNPIKNLDL